MFPGRARFSPSVAGPQPLTDSPRHANTKKVKTMTQAEAKADLDAALDAVRATGEPVMIRRNGSEAYVLTTLADYEKNDETAYLVRSAANREALDLALEQVRRGQVVTPDRALLE